MDAQKRAILYPNATPFLRLSGEDVAQYHGGRVYGHPFSPAAARQESGGSPAAARPQPGGSATRIGHAHRPVQSIRTALTDRSPHRSPHR